MNCPGCQATTTRLTLGGHQGASVEVDLCEACHAFWFDQYESLQLSAASVLKLFSMMADHGTSSQGPEPVEKRQALACPRCMSPLLLTHDRQHNTVFEYWRCDFEHGRFITYINFLREKDFIKPLSPQQLAELQRHVRTINCGNCGAPIDVTRETACPNCGSPLSLLDVPHMEQVLARLQGGEAFERPKEPDPAETRSRLVPFDVTTLAHGGVTVDDDLMRFVSWLRSKP